MKGTVMIRYWWCRLRRHDIEVTTPGSVVLGWGGRGLCYTCDPEWGKPV